MKIYRRNIYYTSDLSTCLWVDLRTARSVIAAKLRRLRRLFDIGPWRRRLLANLKSKTTKNVYNFNYLFTPLKLIRYNAPKRRFQRRVLSYIFFAALSNHADQQHKTFRSTMGIMRFKSHTKIIIIMTMVL